MEGRKKGIVILPDSIFERQNFTVQSTINISTVIIPNEYLVNPHIITFKLSQAEVGKKNFARNFQKIIFPPHSLSLSLILIEDAYTYNNVTRSQGIKDISRKEGTKRRAPASINICEIERRNSFFRKLCVCFFQRESGNWSRGTRPRKLNFAIRGRGKRAGEIEAGMLNK